MGNANKRLMFWWVVAGVTVADLITKRIAETELTHTPVRIAGEWLLLRLVYNPGAAFGINVGEHSRWVFTGLALVALVVLGAMVRQTPPHQRFRLLALGLVCGGALGNLVNRLRSPRGVVDFIDVYIGTYNWPTFNVADMAVSSGAIALAIVLWSEGRERSESADKSASPAEASS